MRQKERGNRKNHRKKVNRPLKRLLHLGTEVWSWQVFHGALMIRGPDGTNYKNLQDNFRVFKWHNWDAWDDDFWSYEGPGFAPGLIKRYIQSVFINGNEWDRDAEWANYMKTQDE